MDSTNIPSLNNLKISNGEIKTPFLIGVAGGTASGKVSFQQDFYIISIEFLSRQFAKE